MLSGVVAGKANKEIGADLGFTEEEVKSYVRRIRAKIGAKNRVEIVIWAYESGYVKVGPRLSPAK